MTQLSLLTLSDIIQMVSEFTTSDAELLAVVTSLINSGQVRLCGKLAGATIDLSRPDEPDRTWCGSFFDNIVNP